MPSTASPAVNSSATVRHGRSSFALRGTIFRPPSEAESLILQATVGCSWNHCTYCAMYREKSFQIRLLEEVVAEVRLAGRGYGTEVTRIFVADGDALSMPLGHWEPLPLACRGLPTRTERSR